MTNYENLMTYLNSINSNFKDTSLFFIGPPWIKTHCLGIKNIKDNPLSLQNIAIFAIRSSLPHDNLNHLKHVDSLPLPSAIIDNIKDSVNRYIDFVTSDDN